MSVQTFNFAFKNSKIILLFLKFTIISFIHYTNKAFSTYWYNSVIILKAKLLDNQKISTLPTNYLQTFHMFFEFWEVNLYNCFFIVPKCQNLVSFFVVFLSSIYREIFYLINKKQKYWKLHFFILKVWKSI